jgi:hypothetical protein
VVPIQPSCDRRFPASLQLAVLELMVSTRSPDHRQAGVRQRFLLVRKRNGVRMMAMISATRTGPRKGIDRRVFQPGCRRAAPIIAALALRRSSSRMSNCVSSDVAMRADYENSLDASRTRKLPPSLSPSHKSTSRGSDDQEYFGPPPSACTARCAKALYPTLGI